MFELITKEKLLRILKELCENTRAEKATGGCEFFTAVALQTPSITSAMSSILTILLEGERK